MCSVNERIENLKKETSNLRKEIKDLKETLMQQNELIISLLSTQTGEQVYPQTCTLDDDTIEAETTLPHELYEKELSEFYTRFPLETIEDLNKFEMEIDEDNKTDIVNIVQSILLPQGLSKNIGNILSDNIIMESNIDGYHYKTRLLNYPKTIDVLFLASRKDDDYTFKMFLADFKRSLRVGKNRCYKNNCRAKQKLSLLKEQEQLGQSGQCVKNFVVKTGNIWQPMTGNLDMNYN